LGTTGCAPFAFIAVSVWQQCHVFHPAGHPVLAAAPIRLHFMEYPGAADAPPGFFAYQLPPTTSPFVIVLLNRVMVL